MSEAMETFFALVNDQILISSQPTQKEIADLKPKYKAVVNLRGVGEPGQASKEEITALCESNDLKYFHYPFVTPEMDKNKVATLVENIRKEVPQPCLIHCKSAGRALVVAMHVAHPNISSDERRNKVQEFSVENHMSIPQSLLDLC